MLTTEKQLNKPIRKTVDKIRIDKNCVDHIPIYKRPFGYMIVQSIDLGQEYPTYWGQIGIRNETQEIRFCYKLEYVSLVRKYYRLSIFKDTEFKKLILAGHISFAIDNSTTPKVFFQYIEQSLEDKIPQELFSFIHIVVYEYLINSFLEEIAFFESILGTNQGITKHEAVFGFEEDIVEDFFDQTFLRLDTFLSLLTLPFG